MGFTPAASISRANTALFSEKSRVTEYLMLDGDILTVTTLLEDPVYMEEPHLQSISFRRNLHQEPLYFPCTIGVEKVAEGFPPLPAWKESLRGRRREKAGTPRRSGEGRCRDALPRVPASLEVLRLE